MKVIYEVLYKNGHLDLIEVPVEEKEMKAVMAINQRIEESMQKDEGGNLTVGDGEKVASFIRLSDVSRVKFSFLKEGGGNLEQKGC
ncbi:hypothetical protein [Bacillus sp. B-jedd]|uniref:hypothetical protein n=1 Tax=Bacillus sp. B-jedd TaxID=1476857 RepID=UPI0005155F67|nr:hypothetical protein [Bacillus sp. B-jedd]CEG28097.1 hypothetical protein BN1002_02976 [Bacillus sp. B-jedd]